MRPAVALSSPEIIRSMVDLPHPEGPTRTTNSPCSDLQIDAVDGDHRAEALRNAMQGKLCHRQPFTAPIVIPLMK